MSRSRIALVAVAVAAFLAGAIIAPAGATRQVAPVVVVAEPGDTWASIEAECDATRQQIRHVNHLGANVAPRIGAFYDCPLSTIATTTTTVAPTTTTVAPTTTTTTTTAVPPTTTAPPLAGFVENFDGNGGLERFRTGVYHRDETVVAQTSWPGDHGHGAPGKDCGDPTFTSRTISRSNPSDSFYVCRNHLMTSVGDTSGYSIAWFTPNQTFEGGVHTRVSFDVNVTDLGTRQWWEVSISPVGSPFLATSDFVAVAAEIPVYDNQTTGIGKGPYGNDGGIVTRGVPRDPLGWGHVCGSGAVDPEGCASKAIRRTFTATDNRNGTITFDFLGRRYTYPGEFPDQFKVYFKDHNYTPDKDAIPQGYTWHWDNIVVT